MNGVWSGKFKERDEIITWPEQHEGLKEITSTSLRRGEAGEKTATGGPSCMSEKTEGIRGFLPAIKFLGGSFRGKAQPKKSFRFGFVKLGIKVP